MASITRDGPGPVLRVTVEFREGHWRIIDRFQVPEMTISSSDDLPPEIDGRHVVDTWFDVLNAEGDIVYRKRMMAPPHSVEMFHPDGSMSRVIVESRPFSNDLLIPDLPEIESLHLYVDHPVPLRGVDREGTLEPVAVFPAREEGGKRPKGRR